MRILHVISAPAAGGAEVYIKDLAKELVAQGHEVHIGFLDRAGDIGRSSEFEKEFLRDLECAGVTYFFVGHIARFLPWLGVKRIEKYVRRNNVEIYHSHLTYGVFFGFLLKIPRVYTHHNVIMRVSRPVFRWLSKSIDSLVGISSICSSTLASYSGRPVTTIFNGVDAGKFDVKTLSTRQLNMPVRCISVGRICEQKNLHLLVDAIAILSEHDRSGIVVEIAGEGLASDTEALDAYIIERGMDRTIRLLGNIGDIPGLMARSDLLLMSSAWEGLPIVLIEASMAGLPCVVTDAGGCRELVDICQNGIVVELGSAEKLAAGIMSVIRDPVTYSTYSENALHRSPAFSIDRATDGHIGLYQKLWKSNRVSL